MRARQRSLPSLLFEDRVDYEWRQPLTGTIADRSGFMLAQFTPPATAIQQGATSLLLRNLSSEEMLSQEGGLAPANLKSHSTSGG